MSFLRKNLSTFLSAFVLCAFLSVLTLETSHHHGLLEGQDRDCSVCSWQQTGSQAVSTSIFPVLLPALMVFALFFPVSIYSSFTFISPRGRSPPLNLL